MWVPLLRQLLAYDTSDLFDEASATDGTLASYFAFLTVEFSPLPSMPIDFARLAVSHDPGTLRCIHAISMNGGVSVLHGSTEQASLALNRLTASLATEKSVSQPLQDATQTAIDQHFSVDAILQLMKAMNEQPAEPGQMLPWSNFAAIMQECQFINAMRRLYFVRYEWSVDSSREIAQWEPLLKHHRYFPVFVSFGDSERIQSRVSAIHFKDNALSHSFLNGNWKI